MTTFNIEDLKFDDRGLIPAIAQESETGEVLMLAWMNAESIRETIETGRVVYWSRSRANFWRKGDASGHIQRLVDLRFDCDRDCILLIVEQVGAACHTFRKSCFYTAVREGTEVELMKPMLFSEARDEQDA